MAVVVDVTLDVSLWVAVAVDVTLDVSLWVAVAVQCPLEPFWYAAVPVDMHDILAPSGLQFEKSSISPQNAILVTLGVLGYGGLDPG